MICENVVVPLPVILVTRRSPFMTGVRDEPMQSSSYLQTILDIRSNKFVQIKQLFGTDEVSTNRRRLLQLRLMLRILQIEQVFRL